MRLLSLLFSAGLALSCFYAVSQAASVQEILVGALTNFAPPSLVARAPLNSDGKSETGIAKENDKLLSDDDEEEVEDEDQDFEDDDDDEAVDVDGVVGNVNSIAHLHRKNGEVLIPCFGMWWPAGGGGYYEYGGGYYYTGDYKRKRKRSKKQKKSAKSKKKKA